MKLFFPFIFILFFLATQKLFSGNNELDSMLNLLHGTKADSTKANILIDLFKGTIYSNSDTAKSFAIQGLQISTKNKDRKKIAQFLRYIGIVYQIKGDYNKALDYFTKSLNISLEMNNKKGISYSYVDIGLIYYNQGKYLKSIEFYQKALKIAEDLKDKIGISSCLQNIGNIYSDQKNYVKARVYYKKAIIIYKENADEKGVSDCLNNIGTAYLDEIKTIKNAKKKFLLDSALNYYSKALTLREQINNKEGISECYTNIAKIHTEKKETEKALELFNKSLSICKYPDDKYQISLNYEGLGNLYSLRKEYDKAILYYMKGESIAKDLGNYLTLFSIYFSLPEIFSHRGDYKKAYEYQVKLKTVNDSIFNAENNKVISNVTEEYENQKQQLVIQNLHKDKELQATELNKQKTVRNYLYGVMGLVLLIVFLMIIAYRTKQKANRQLQILNAEINGQKMEIEFKNEELNQQNDEIRAQRDEIDHQRKLIEERNREVMDSIHYAKRIQSAILPNKEFLDALFFDYFVLFHPKDIVSGDFFWAGKRKNLTLIAAADCTGHGVPGAFMSMLGGSFLNEIVAKDDVLSTNQVLDNLRKYVIDSLQQKGVFGEQKDGMDLAFCALDTETNKLQFSGANNPCWVIRIESGIPKILEFPPDKMPIAIYENMSPFTKHDIQLQKNDIFYIFSDGFYDQLGGPNQKKMLKKRFRELLLQYCNLPMQEQREQLLKAHDRWRGSQEQIDDILVIGVKI